MASPNTDLDDTIEVINEDSPALFTKPRLLRCTSTPVVTLTTGNDLELKEAHLSFGGCDQLILKHPRSAFRKAKSSANLAGQTFMTSSKLRSLIEAEADREEEEQDDSGVHSMSMTSEMVTSDIMTSEMLTSEDHGTVSIEEEDEEAVNAPKRKKLNSRPTSWLRRKALLRDRDLCSASSSAASMNSSLLTSFKRFSCYSPGQFADREHLDFIRYLSDMNIHHAVDLILTYLSDPADLCNLAKVSTKWKQAVEANFKAVTRKNDFLREKQLKKENLSDRTSEPYFDSPRKAMGDKSNVVTPPKMKKPPVKRSPGGAKRQVLCEKERHDLFREEASKLSPGELLQNCPRCTSPSRVNLEKFAALCSRRSCGFEFCTKCNCSMHEPGTKCKRSTKSALSGKVASKKSRSRLRRL